MKVILYGSYARGDYQDDSDIDIMILLDIKPIAKSEEHFYHWVAAYSFYSNIDSEGIRLYTCGED